MIDVLPGIGTIGHADRPRQHASHRRLVDRDVVPTRRVPIDAIIVPAARNVARLEPAVRLAAKLQCPVVALCSRGAQAAEMTAAREPNVIAVDVRDKADRLPLLTTAMLDGSRFARASDTSLKRNLGLALTRMVGWQRVLFLDDDITGLEAAVIEQAASLLDDFGTVALDNLGYPDNSVVCHANRDTGSEQSTFVGAGAMLFPASRATSFFPDIYNEDWFFLLEGNGSPTSRCTGPSSKRSTTRTPTRSERATRSSATASRRASSRCWTTGRRSVTRTAGTGAISWPSGGR